MRIEVDAVFNGKHQVQLLDLRVKEMDDPILRIFARPPIWGPLYDPAAEINVLTGPFKIIKRGGRGGIISKMPESWKRSKDPDFRPLYMRRMTQKEFFEYDEASPGQCRAFESRFYSIYPEGFPGSITEM